MSKNNYDALFKIRNNYLVYAEFDSLICEQTENKTLVIPQNYASSILGIEEGDGIKSLCCALEESDAGSGIYAPWWIYLGEGEDE